MVLRTTLIAGGLLAIAASANSVIVTVFVLEMDFSTSMSQIIDPTIQVGDTIRWDWQSPLHSTTSVAGSAESWNSGLQNPPFTFDHTFNTVGVFQYYCQAHGFDNGNGTAGGMAGTVTVNPVPEPATLLAFAAAGAIGLVSKRRRVSS